MVCRHSSMLDSQGLWDTFKVFSVKNDLFKEFMLAFEAHCPHISKWPIHPNQLWVMINKVMLGMQFEMRTYL